MSFNGFILLDLETTGLKPSEGHILELGMALYSPQLEMIDAFQSVCLTDQSYSFLRGAPGSEDWKSGNVAYDMHVNSGLLAEVMDLSKQDILGDGNDFGPYHLYTVMHDAINWLKSNDVERGHPLCGSSIHFDREWLNFFGTEEFNGYFHYRNIDFSSISEHTKVINPKLYEKAMKLLAPTKSHRVLQDIVESVQLLGALREVGAVAG
ncbi:oligoribonuclease [Rhodococcus phage ReqiDocB7]|uniref:oligoribonuclease n=1 Tax=Rhodococcus phage ReqiDocB7 TaxID=691966 RepID=UPI0001CDD76F|nr:oligoribonuclease [Rhodococcus phage ReqiDocB7]ADD80831.1 oligoribonuclease [Rhodococcus phage ReqiDocB7]